MITDQQIDAEILAQSDGIAKSGYRRRDLG